MKALLRTAGILTVASASVLTGVTAAQAAPACSTARVCLYDNYWFTGTQRTYNWVASYVGDTANDKASSIVIGPPANIQSPYVYLYRDLNYSGHAVIFRGGNAVNDLRGVSMYAGVNWDDEISSIWG
ncbi:peptidase inhibitor family I36 protein [Arthrobacter sp. 18067]|uniref:peptidase inhibitor family I36 protein n=1 Tax=Arthrobacter sp. 18067 TaxID=2681413 RepID=UPI00135B0BC9|nr:peptidase inhibitor family I36 protein [Arthrobacter sp. 18067]